MAQSTDIVVVFYGWRSVRQTTILVLLENISSTVWCKLGELLEYVVAMPVQKMSTSLQCSVFSGAMQPTPFGGTKAFCTENPSQTNESKDGGLFLESPRVTGGFHSLKISGMEVCLMMTIIFKCSV